MTVREWVEHGEWTDFLDEAFVVGIPNACGPIPNALLAAYRRPLTPTHGIMRGLREYERIMATMPQSEALVWNLYA